MTSLLGTEWLCNNFTSLGSREESHCLEGAAGQLLPDPGLPGSEEGRVLLGQGEDMGLQGGQGGGQAGTRHPVNTIKTMEILRSCVQTSQWFCNGSVYTEPSRLVRLVRFVRLVRLVRLFRLVKLVRLVRLVRSGKIGKIGKIGKTCKIGKIGNIGRIGRIGKVSKIGKIGKIGRIDRIGKIS